MLQDKKDESLVRVGCTSYHDFFTQEELKQLEKLVDGVEIDANKNKFLQNTSQPTYGGFGRVKRTKFFFGSRYMWSKQQLAEPQSRIAAGVRADVSEVPEQIF